MKRRILVGLGVVLVVVACVAVWLLFTASGARFVVARVQAAAPGLIETRDMEGTLAGPLRVGHLRIAAPGVTVDATTLELDWSPLALLAGRLRIELLRAESLEVSTEAVESSNTGDGWPALPLPVRIDTLEIRRAEVRSDGKVLLSDARISAAGSASGQGLALERIEVQATQGAVSGHAGIPRDSRDSWSVALEWRIGAPGPRALTGTTRIDGRLGDLSLDQVVAGVANGSIEGRIRGLPDAATASLSVRWEALAPEGPWPPVFAGASGNLRLEGSVQSLTARGEIRVPVIAEGAVGVDWRCGWREGRLEADPLTLEFANEGRAVLSGALLPARDWAVEARLEGQRLGWPLGSANPEVPVPDLDVSVDGDLAAYSFQAAGQAGYGLLPVSAVRARGAWRGLVLGFDELRVEAPDQQLSATGRGGLDFGRERFTYTFDLSGSADLDRLPPLEGSLVGQGDTAGLSLDSATVGMLGGQVHGQGRLAWEQPRRTALSASFRDLDPSYYWPAIAGAVSGEIELTGEGDRIEASLENLGGQINGQPVSGSARGAIADGSYSISNLSLDLGSARLTADGSVSETLQFAAQLRAPDLGDVLPGASGDLEARISASGPVPVPTIEARIEASDVRAFGTLAGSAVLDGRLALAPGESSRVEISTRGLAWGAGRPMDLDAVVAGTRAEHGLDLKGEIDGIGVQGRVRGSFDGARWSGELDALQFTDDGSPAWTLQAPTSVEASADRFELESTCLDGILGRGCARASWTAGHAWQVGVELASFDLEAVSTWLHSPYLARGDVSGHAEAAGEAGQFTELTGHIELTQGAIFDATETDDALYEWHAGRLDLSGDPGAAVARAMIDLADEDRFEATVSIAWNEADPSLAGHADVAVDALPVISEVFPDLTSVTGHTRAELELAGTLGAPELTGSLVLENGAAQFPALGISPHDIQARADFSGRQVQLSMSAVSGKGTLEASGELEFGAEGGVEGRIRMSGSQVLVADMPQAQVYASPDLQLTYRGNELHVVGDVAIPTGRLTGLIQTGAVNPSPDEVIVGEVNDEGASVVSRVRVRVGPDVTVDLKGLSGRLEGEVLTVVDPPALPSGNGKLEFLDGSLTVFGQRLEIQRGALIYTGGPLEDPAIDVSAVREVDDITAGARARGPIRQPEITLFSDPPMSRAETLSYLTTGKPVGDLRGGEKTDVGQAASALALAGGSLVAGEVGERIGIDELGFEGDDETGETSLVIGKWLSPQVYVSYGVGLLEAVNVLKLRYRLNRKLSIELSSSNESAADVIYTIERD